MAKLEDVFYPQVMGMPEVEQRVDSYGFLDVNDKTIIFTNNDGLTYRYGDDTWRFESKKDVLSIHFNFDASGLTCAQILKIKDDLKQIHFALLYAPTSGNKAQQKYGFSRQRIANYALRFLIEVAISNNLDFQKFFTGKYNHYLEDVMTLRVFRGLKYVIEAYAFFKNTRFTALKKLIPLKKSFSQFIYQKNREFTLDRQQTYPIPERIYLKALNKIEEDLSKVDSDLIDQVIHILTKNLENPLYALPRSGQASVFKKSPEYKSLLKKNNWSRLSKMYDFDVPDEEESGIKEVYRRLDVDLTKKSIDGLRKYLTQVQLICFKALVAYTGGRLGDISYLNSACLKTHKIGKKKFPLIYGEVQKGAVTDNDVEFWVTNESGAKAHSLVKKISDFIYENATNSCYTQVPIEERLLFVSQYSSMKKNNKHIISSDLQSTFSKWIIDDVVINEEDRIELLRLDPNIDLEEEIAEGAIWKFKTHQFRRSLALYAMASGAVSLPSLRRQLRQLGEAMTLYYSGGSCAASNIIEKQNSFAKECYEAKPASTAIALHKFVVSNEKIFGGMGHHLDKNPNLKNIIMNQDISETQEMIERGELAYSETALGGCGETGNCDYRPFALMDTSHCTHCEKAYHKLSVMNKTIKIFEISLENIPVNTRQYQWRKTQIGDLKQLRYSHLAQEGENHDEV
ncbi:MAG: hypothetical protein U9N57_09545 [Pseudomonadota bacterium]|nr:hypothetical protein [Pseudomonadota bacterium]